jgi:hypothetical protein
MLAVFTGIAAGEIAADLFLLEMTQTGQTDSQLVNASYYKESASFVPISFTVALFKIIKLEPNLSESPCINILVIIMFTLAMQTASQYMSTSFSVHELYAFYINRNLFSFFTITILGGELILKFRAMYFSPLFYKPLSSDEFSVLCN